MLYVSTMNWSRSAVMSCIYCFAFCEHLVKGSMGDFFRNYITRRHTNSTDIQNTSVSDPMDREISLLAPMDLDMATRMYSTRHMFILSSMS